MVTNPEEQQVEQQIEAPLRGRAAMMDLYKKRNPDMSDEPDDDSLYDFASRGYAEHDDLKGKYDILNGANETLASAVGDIPMLARWLSGIGHGENPWKHLGRILGPKCENLDDEAIAQLKEGQAEFDERFKKIGENFKNYEKDLADYAQENSLSEEMVDEIDGVIMDVADAFAERVIPKDFIKFIHEALDAPAKIAEAEAVSTAELEAAKVAGANEAIEGMKGGKSEATPVPDLGGNKGKASKMPAKPRFNDQKPRDYSDRLEKVEK